MTLTDEYGNPRRPARFSQCSKILRVLEDGEWHTTRDLLREVPSIIHSRISELRKRGYTIEHETTGAGAAGSRYRLIVGVTPTEVSAGEPHGLLAVGASTSSSPTVDEEGAPSPAEQFSIEVLGVGSWPA